MRGRFRVACLLLLAAAACAGAAPPDAPAALSVQPGQVVRVAPLADKGKTLGVIRGFKDEDAFFDELVPGKDGQRRFMFQATRPGTYTLGWYTVGDADGGSITTITVAAPVPVPPPTPTPQPPTPGPNPVDPAAPIPAAGLHVLVVYDAAKLSTLTAEQQGAIFSKDVRDYLRATCPKGADGVTPEWRMWPADVDAAGESRLWQDAFKRPRASLPWVIVSNGATGFEGPLPGSAADMIALLKKFGGK